MNKKAKFGLLEIFLIIFVIGVIFLAFVMIIPDVKSMINKKCLWFCLYDKQCFTNIAKDFCESQDMSFDHLIGDDGFVCKGDVRDYRGKEFKFTEEEIKSCYERR